MYLRGFPDEALGADVIQMSAIDPDAGSVLEYFFVGPISAQDPSGNEVNAANRYDVKLALHNPSMHSHALLCRISFSWTPSTASLELTRIWIAIK